MKPYSEDLRRAVVAALGRGMKRSVAVETFGVSLPSIKRRAKRDRETGELAPKPTPGPPAVKRDALMAARPARLAERADATLEAHCSWWHERSGVEVSGVTPPARGNSSGTLAPASVLARPRRGAHEGAR